jgi:hypothetical protein
MHTCELQLCILQVGVAACFVTSKQLLSPAGLVCHLPTYYTLGIIVAHRRVRGDAYYQLLDEFLTAVRRRYGNTTLIHFNDMAYDNAAKLLNMYRTDFPCFSDELQVRLLLLLLLLVTACHCCLDLYLVLYECVCLLCGVVFWVCMQAFACLPHCGCCWEL